MSTTLLPLPKRRPTAKIISDEQEARLRKEQQKEDELLKERHDTTRALVALDEKIPGIYEYAVHNLGFEPYKANLVAV